MKQQKQIALYLNEMFGAENGAMLYQKQSQRLQQLFGQIKGKSDNQVKTLKETVLPHIALYLVLQESAEYQKNALEIVSNYMCEVVGKQKHASMARMEKVPFFYAIFSRVFLHIMKTTDLQESSTKQAKKSYDITITRCLWHDACVENGCPELCACFCKVDDITYGNLNKVNFSRTQTLGYGGTCCDFHFYAK